MSRSRGPFIHLGKSERDRTIAAWLEEATHDPEINVSEIVKEHLYRVATGRAADPTIEELIRYMDQRFDELRALLLNAQLSGQAPAPARGDEEDLDEIARRLGSIED